MGACCGDLDSFFDGELASHQAAGFRDHLAGCARCQAALHGRMQEAVVVGPRDAWDRRRRLRGFATGARPRLRMPRPRYVVAALVAAAVAAVWLARPHTVIPTAPLQVALAIDHAVPTIRGEAAHVGDRLRVTARAPGYRAIWVYLGDHELVAVCPGGPSCRVTPEVVGMDLPLAVRGTYAIVSLGAGSPLPVPSGTLDADVGAASTIEGTYQVGYVNVD